MAGEHLSPEQADEYAIGSLDLGLARIVALHIVECTACRGLVHDAEDVAAALALSTPLRRSPPRLKQRVMVKAGLRRPGVFRRLAFVGPAAAGIAAVTVAIMAFTGMVSLRGQVNDLRRQNSDLQAQISTALAERTQIASISQRLSAAESTTRQQGQQAVADRELLLAMLSPRSVVAEVYATSSQQNAVGRLIWSPQQKTVFFIADNLGPIPGTKTYQLWVSENGQYSSLGTFRPDASGFARYSATVPEGMSGYDTAVVTVEPAGGASQRSGPSIFAADLSSFHSGLGR